MGHAVNLILAVFFIATGIKFAFDLLVWISEKNRNK